MTEHHDAAHHARSTGDRAWPARVRRRLGAQRGASPIELAILMPVILLMLFGAIQIAAVYLARATALSAAQQAVTADRMWQAEPEAGRKRAEAFIADAGDWLIVSDIDITETDTEVSCVVTGDALSIVPGWTIEVSQSATSPRERFNTLGSLG